MTLRAPACRSQARVTLVILLIFTFSPYIELYGLLTRCIIVIRQCGHHTHYVKLKKQRQCYQKAVGLSSA